MDPTVPVSEEFNNTLARIKSTTRMLNEIKYANLKIVRNGFRNPMYENTALDRANEPYSTTIESDDVILRKNIFHIANKVQNTNELLIALTNRGLLTPNDVDLILPHNDDLFKAIAIFSQLITKEPSQFAVLLDVLRQCHNLPIAALLESSARTLGNENAATASGLDKNTWSCQNCTFLNTSSTICEMCFKSKDYKTATANSTLVCRLCTYFNPPGNSHCEMCNHPVGSDSGEDDEDETDSCCANSGNQYQHPQKFNSSDDFEDCV